MLREILVSFSLAVAASFSASAQVAPPETFSAWVLPDDSKDAGYQLELTSDDGPLATLVPPFNASGSASEGNVEATTVAEPYRWKVVKLTAWLRVAGGPEKSRARLWMKIDRPARDSNIFDNLSAKGITSDEWTPSEITLSVAGDATSITYGVSSEGGARVQLRDVSLTAIPSEGVTPNDLSLAEPESPLMGFGSRLRVPEFSALPEPPSGPDLPPPDIAERVNVINAAARLALRYVKTLPDFLCTENVRRAEKANNGPWRQKDVIAIRVGFSNGVEQYRLLTVNGKPSATPLASISGAKTEGEYGSLQEELFRPQAAQFTWDHWATIRGRTVYVFRYVVKLEKSDFRLQFESSLRQPVEVVSAYHGTVYIDRETNEVLRIELIADPPEDFPLRESRNIVEYDHREVGGQQYLLPIAAESFIRSKALASHNIIELRDYQKFSAESRIEFQ